MLSVRLYENYGITRNRALVALCVFFFLILIAGGNKAASSSSSQNLAASSFNETNSSESEAEYEVADTPADKSSSKAIADELATALLERIGKGRGPIIEGGIGDSGTRGVRDVLKHLGAVMVDEQHVVTGSKDSLLYMHAYDTVTSAGKHVMRAPAGLYNLPIRTTHTLNYNASMLPVEHWQTGRQWVAKMIGKTMSVNQQLRGESTKLDPWGFKHPRTALLVPFWHGALRDKFLYVHVMRDGKDIVEGDNQKVFNDHCALYYGRHCDLDSVRQRLEFWADLNRDVFNYALHSSMKGSQYLAIRIEDLVVGNARCFYRLAAYIGLSKAEADELVPKAIEANKGHQSSYFGHKWKPSIKNEVEKKALQDSDANEALHFWGYDTKTYNFTLDCESLPWLEKMRKAKGPLPGDSF